MGATQTKATNIVNDALTETLSSITKQNQSAIFTEVQENQIIVDAGGDADIDGIKQGNVTSVNVDALFSTLSSNDLTNKLQATISQKASASSGWLGFGTADSTNVQNVSSALNTTIKNISNNKCVQNVTQSNVLKVKASNNVVIKNVDQSNLATVLVKCVMEDSAVTKAVNDMQVKQDQTAVAKTTDPLGELGGFFYIIAAAIILAIIILKKPGGGGPTDSKAIRTKFILGSGVLGGFTTLYYFLHAKKNGWSPLKPKSRK